MTDQRKNKKFSIGFGVIWSFLFEKETKFENVCIQGKESFRKKVSLALVLIKEKEPEILKKVNEYVDFIIEGQKTMLSLTRLGGTLVLSPEHVDESETWLAGLIAYEASRSALFFENLKKYGSPGKIPKELYEGRKVWDLHYECLQRLGADYEELKQVADFIETR